MRLIHGDCIEEMQKLIDESIMVDLTVTSPPYDNLRNYNNSLNWNFDIFKQVADKLYQITKDGGVIVWVVNDATINGSETGTSFKQALYFKKIGFNLHDTMLYIKKNYVPLTHNRYEQCFEYMFILTKGKPKTFNPIKVPCKEKGRIATHSFYKSDDDKLTRKDNIKTKDTKIHPNKFEYGVGGGTAKYKHPAMFPLQLAKDHILSWSNPNDLVLDCFMGSGTVGVACQELNREFIGIEIEKKYYDISVERTKQYQTTLRGYNESTNNE